MDIGIIGAGMSTVGFITNLKGSHEISIFDKAKVAGGRLTMHSREHEGNVIKFNLGAQYVKAHSLDFKRVLEDAGCKALSGSILDNLNKSIIKSSDKFVHKDGLHSVVRYHLDDKNIELEKLVTNINLKESMLSFNSSPEKKFDLIISSIPLPQFNNIANIKTSFNDDLYSKCLAVGVLLKNEMPFKHTCYKNISEKLSWASLSSSFCDESPTSITMHFSQDFSNNFFDLENKDIASIAIDDIVKSLGIDKALFTDNIKVFKWRYALCKKNYTKEGYMKINDNVFAIGDWALGPRVESAYESGKHLAQLINP
jgi:predicted NAD/FAD-dependent oxidoreductase